VPFRIQRQAPHRLPGMPKVGAATFRIGAEGQRKPNYRFSTRARKRARVRAPDRSSTETKGGPPAEGWGASGAAARCSRRGENEQRELSCLSGL
jgi:hypothetical protein